MALQPRTQYRTAASGRWRPYNPDRPPDPSRIAGVRVHPDDLHLIREQTARYWVWVKLDNYPAPGFTTSARVSEESTGWVMTDLAVSRSPVFMPDDPIVNKPPWLSNGIVTKNRNEAGVTPSILRGLKMSEIRQAVLDRLDQSDLDLLPRAETAFEALRGSMSADKRGKRDPLTKARLAASYEALVRTGVSKGIHAELGEVTGKRPSTVSAYIRELRTEGYLTFAGSGKAGGVMTEKSRKILRQAGEM